MIKKASPVQGEVDSPQAKTEGLQQSSSQKSETFDQAPFAQGGLFFIPYTS